MKISRTLAIAGKEMMHIMRDPFTLGMAIGVPIGLVLYFGFSIDFDYRGVKLAVYDNDNTFRSRQFTEVFLASGYFRLDRGRYEGSPTADLETEEDYGSVIIPPGFGKKAASGSGAYVQVLIDGSDPQKTGSVARYIISMQSAVNAKLTGAAAALPVTARTRYLYNPELNTKWFIVPGLFVIIIGLLSVLMTALTVAREWENGSMELLLSTPVEPAEIIIGKILPYVGLVSVGVILIFGIARLVFGVPFEGSILTFIIACFIFVTASLAQGILISVITRQQQKAMQLSLISAFLPAMLLSGFIFPVESMPLFFRVLTLFLPARWFMSVVRALFLKGAGIAEMAGPFLFMLIIGLILILAAVKKFKREIE